MVKNTSGFIYAKNRETEQESYIPVPSVTIDWDAIYDYNKDIGLLKLNGCIKRKRLEGKLSRIGKIPEGGITVLLSGLYKIKFSPPLYIGGVKQIEHLGKSFKNFEKIDLGKLQRRGLLHKLKNYFYGRL